MHWLREMIDFVDLQTLQVLVVVVGLIAFTLAETVVPERRETLTVRARSGLRNLTLYVIGMVVTSAVIGTFYYLGAAFLAANRVGLLYVVPLPAWVSLLLAFLALDFTDYLFHGVSHEKRWLWVMHAVRHLHP
jgi:sterol desaturase/sphingolipid hydroxylase (fatty acid hydroxylase superfamily)